MPRFLFTALVAACPVFLAGQDAAMRVVVLNQVKVLDVAGGSRRTTWLS